MNVNEVIKKLQKDPDIVITGPDCSDSNKLRVYANGGLIGKIYIGNRPNGSVDLISSGYYKYSGNDAGGFVLESIVNKFEDPLRTIVDDEYIFACKQAVENRFGKKKKDSTEQGEKERHVQTRIVKKYMSQRKEWCIVDMEMQCPKSWFIGNNFSVNTTKQPRFDMVVLNRDGVGIIELKVNNENAENMESHYEHMEFLLTNDSAKKHFLGEIGRRVGSLCDNGLLSKEVLSFHRDSLWCGFLFVGGRLNDTKDIVKTLRNKKLVDGLKFLYYPSFEIDKIDINSSVSYREFLNI